MKTHRSKEIIREFFANAVLLAILKKLINETSKTIGFTDIPGLKGKKKLEKSE